MVDKKTKKVICTYIAGGRKHDFRMFKESKVHIPPSIKTLTDSGYQGIKKLHDHAELPIKGTKKKPLTKAAKLYNHTISSQRIMVEHVIREIKIFKIISDRYRNRRRRFGLRFNLIAAIYNLELKI